MPDSHDILGGWVRVNVFFIPRIPTHTHTRAEIPRIHFDDCLFHNLTGKIVDINKY